MRIKKRDYFLYLSIILMSISPSFALGDDNRNYILICFMIIMPFICLFKNLKFDKIDFSIILLSIFLVFFPYIFHYENFRYTTVFYSVLLFLFFLSVKKRIELENFYLVDLYNVTKILIISYCVMLVIQQLCVIFSLPILNISQYDPNHPFKLNSLMSEPSHSSRVLILLMYIFILCQRKLFSINSFLISFKHNRYTWVSFLWALLTMGSTAGLIFLLVIVLEFINIKYLLSSILLCIFVSVLFFSFSDNKYFMRAKNTIIAVATLDENKIINNDLSASFRIVPSIYGIKAIGISTIDDWFGHGIDADKKDIRPLPTVKLGSAGSFFIWYNYGLLCQLLYWMITFLICFSNKNKISILIWFLYIFIPGNINSQLVCLTLCFIYILNYINNKLILQK